MSLIAIAREVSASIGRCELSHVEREAIDLERARAEHRSYLERLAELGCRVILLTEEPELPDAVFVEDAAVVVDELAVITRPGAESRRPELDSVAEALRPHRPLARIEAPATLDGGDVLVLGREVRVGLSGRTDAAGLEALRMHLAPLGYRVQGAQVRGCLHLKSAVTAVGPAAVLVQPAWVDALELALPDGTTVVEVDPAEPFAANALLVGDAVLHPARFPLTRRRLEERGVRVVAVEAAELAKAEGGVTCSSIVLREG